MSLEQARKTIDAVDPQIKALFLQRMQAARLVAEAKHEAGESTVFRADREADIIRRGCEGVPEALVPAYTAFLKKTMEVSRLVQYDLLTEWTPSLLEEAVQGLAARPEDSFVRLSFARPDVAGGLSLPLTIVGDRGFAVEDIRLASRDAAAGTATFELTVRANLLARETQVLLFELLRECEDMRVLASW